jgi:adenine-specific DNA-methyltransferase
MRQTNRLGKPRQAKRGTEKREADYRHPEAETPLRPDVGTQAQFRKKKPPVTYRYDSSLAPALDWDGQNPAREQGEAAIREILDLDTAAIDAAETAEDAKKAARSAVAYAKAAAETLKRLGEPFLDWAGKAERLSFDVPTLPLFVHERLSTKAIIETLKSHEKRTEQADMFDLFGDPKRSVADQVLKAYEYKDKWVNRLILGDSLVVMNSLLHYEGLGGQVQMIYIDPPYGVKFGSNFQPFVRKRDVSPSDDADMTREPEMVKAYRDTWELGLHSYLTYLRDRLLLARDLLHPSGSVFVQIGDENVHHVRELMDEVFGPENFVVQITFAKTSGCGSRICTIIRTFIVSSPAAVPRSTGGSGSPVALGSSCPSVSSRGFSGGCSSTSSAPPSRPAGSASSAGLPNSGHPPPSPTASVNSAGSNGWSTPSRPSAAPPRCWPISAATPIASPSPTSAWPRCPTTRFASPGGTTPTTARPRS